MYALEELRKSEAFQAAVAELTAEFAFSARVEPDGTAVPEALTSGFHKLLGYTLAEVLELGGWHVVVHPHDLPLAQQEMQRLLAGETIDGEMRHVAKDGRVLWVHYRTLPIRDESGRVVRLYGASQDITRRKQSEHALLEQRRKYEAVLNTTPDLAYVFDLQHRFIYANQGLLQMWGRTWEEAIGKTCLELGYEPWHAALHDREIEQVVATRQPIRGQVPFTGTFGRRIYDYIFSPVVSEQGAVIAVAGTTRDVTEHKQKEESLRVNRESLYDLVERAPFGIYIVDSQFRIAQLNADSQERAFRNVRPAVGRDFAEAMRILWPEPIATEVIDHFRHTLDTGEPYYSRDYIHPRADINEVESYEWELHRIQLPDGQPGVVCYYYDSTQLRRAEEALRQSEEQLELIANSVPALISYVDPDCRYRMCNAAYTAWFGLTREQIVGRTMGEVLGEKAWQVIGPHVAEALTGRAVEYEAEAHYRRGGVRWIHASYTPHRGADGTVAGVVVLVTDITPHKRAAQALLDSEARFRNMADHAPVMVWVTEPDGHCSFLSKSWYEFTGQTPASGLGLGWLDAVHEEDRPRAKAALTEATQRHAPLRLEYRLRRADGVYRWAIDAAVPRVGEAGEFLGYIGSVIDNTEAKQTEQALREADRKKDEFLATLAHELRNPLAPIRNSLHLLRLGQAEPAANEHVLEIMERQVNHMVRLVDDLLEVSRITRGKVELRKDRVELAAVIRSAVETSQPLIDAARHQLAISLPPEPLSLDVDAVRIAQVLSNLLNNAAKYMDAGGQIFLTARQEGSDVSASVKDTGVGIAPDMLSQVFQMFAQVPLADGRASGGLGIGLALARNLVELHGGSLEAHSRGLGHGSEFILRLPLAIPAPAAPASPPLTPQSAQRPAARPASSDPASP